MLSVSQIAEFDSRFPKGSTVYGVSPSGEIKFGIFRGVFLLPGRIYVRYQVDISEKESEHYPVDKNRVFESFEEANACSKKLLKN